MAKAGLASAVGAGFDLIRRRPAAVAVWGLLYALLNLGPLALMGAIGGTDLIDAYRQIFTDPSSASEVAPVFARLQAVQGVSYLAALLSVAVLYTAIFRAVLRPQETSMFSLRLGVAEFRVAIVTVVLYVFFAIGIFAFILVAMIPIVGMVAVSGGEPSPIAIVLIVLLVLAAMLALVPVAARMAMAVPMTVADDRFRLFEAWKLTKGYGWKLFGLFVLLMLILLLLQIVFGAAIFGTAAALLGASPGGIVGFFARPDWASMAMPFLVVGGALWCVFGALLLPITIAPWARAYQLIAGTSEPNTPSVFD